MPEATLGRQRSVLERTNPLLGAVVHQCLISCGQWSASLADVERWAQRRRHRGLRRPQSRKCAAILDDVEFLPRAALIMTSQSSYLGAPVQKRKVLGGVIIVVRPAEASHRTRTSDRSRKLERYRFLQQAAAGDWWQGAS